ncbi:MAG: class I SAM-dependent methyltransferase, partial [Blautia sp.]|nr:class I SAM-dependent methyltransferase [Blautia sp.]
LTDWDMSKIICQVANKHSRILDLGTGGGEKVLQYFPDMAETLGTDFSEAMIETANRNLKESGTRHHPRPFHRCTGCAASWIHTAYPAPSGPFPGPSWSSQSLLLSSRYPLPGSPWPPSCCKDSLR